jgi:hypothetical protein
LSANFPVWRVASCFFLKLGKLLPILRVSKGHRGGWPSGKKDSTRKRRVRFADVGKHNCGMNTRLFKDCRACMILVALAALTETPTRGAAYLPLVGPPPMRFEKATGGSKTISWAPPALIPPAVVVEPTLPSVTTTIPVNNVVSPHPVIEPANTPVPLPPENLSTNSAVQTRSANELLVVTPEMLVDYFKPNNNSTNAANVHVLVPVNFTPPASALMPSSQANYRSP